MTTDDRARRAAEELRRSVAGTDPNTPGAELERFHRERRRRAQRQRRTAGLVAAAIAVPLIAVLASVVHDRPPVVPATADPTGRILFGRWSPTAEQGRWFTANADGTDVRSLGVTGTCARWTPDGSRILITNDAAFGRGHPLRPAFVDPDGSDLQPLDATAEPRLNLGCGDVSSDGRLIAIEGFTDDGSHNGIYLIRASDGGGLRAVSISPPGQHMGDPVFSPDGSRIAFFRDKPGVSPPGGGAIFVVDRDGSALHRITTWGGAFLDQSWSPDGRWIVFQRPYGVLTLVHPDGTGRHDVPLDLPAGAGAANPSWSPDGRWIIFSLARNGSSNIYRVHPDGTALTRVTTTPGVLEQSPTWTK